MLFFAVDVVFNVDVDVRPEVADPRAWSLRRLHETSPTSVYRIYLPEPSVHSSFVFLTFIFGAQQFLPLTNPCCPLPAMSCHVMSSQARVLITKGLVDMEREPQSASSLLSRDIDAGWRSYDPAPFWVVFTITTISTDLQRKLASTRMTAL